MAASSEGDNCRTWLIKRGRIGVPTTRAAASCDAIVAGHNPALHRGHGSLRFFHGRLQMLERPIGGQSSTLCRLARYAARLWLSPHETGSPSLSWPVPT